MHSGLTPTADEDPRVGATIGNTRSVMHGLYMTRDGYIERQDESDPEWICKLTENTSGSVTGVVDEIGS